MGFSKNESFPRSTPPSISFPLQAFPSRASSFFHMQWYFWKQLFNSRGFLSYCSIAQFNAYVHAFFTKGGKKESRWGSVCFSTSGTGQLHRSHWGTAGWEICVAGFDGTAL